MSVGKVCQLDVDVVGPTESVRNAAERMRQRTVGCLVVVNEGQFPIGILTDRDLVMRAIAEGRDADATSVADVMTKSPELAQEDMPIESALALMRHGCFRRLPVIDQVGKLTGLVTIDDILILLAEEFTQIGEVLRSETPRAIALNG